MPDTKGVANPMAADIADQPSAGDVDVGGWIRKAAQAHNVRYAQAPIACALLDHLSCRWT
jgi:hypothetical protein